jgi:nitrogen regulatory protein PII
MESGYLLLTAIVNTGCADDVMAEARKAGARGGTILTARGTGTEEDVKFFGITLVPEKEVLLIVAEKEGAESVLAAMRSVPVLREPGGGIVYTQNVEQFIVLGG